ncbi:MAG: substrate-binding domain-containing protein [Syntrophales bacterium]
MKKSLLFFAVFAMLNLIPLSAIAEEISIVGTGSGAEILQHLGKAFTKANPDVTISVPKSIGSGGAIKAAGTDTAKIGRTARGIKDKEKSYGLTYVPVAKLPIVIMTHKGVGVKNLTPQQICDIYSGKISNWKEVGGKEGNIRVIRRENGDSSLEVLLKTLAGYKEITVTAKSKETLSDPETIELAAKTPGTIAYGTYPNAKVSDVAIVTIGGKNPASADYPYAGELALVFKDKNKAGNIAKFLEFVKSAAANDTIKGAGGLTL